MKSNYLLDIFVDSKNRIWYGSHTGLSVFDGKNIRNFDNKDGLPSSSVPKIFEDSKGQIWVLSNTHWNDNGGISKIDENYNIINFNTDNKISGHGFTEIEEDLEGNMLFGGLMGFYL